MHELAEPSDLAPASIGAADSLLRRAARNAFPFVVVGALWEIVAHAGLFPARFFPPLETIAAAFARLTVSGVLPHHALDTLIRLLLGFALAAIVGVTVGILMGRSRRAEDILLPLVSIGAPIPGLYAAGNSASTVMGTRYAGAGATIAPAMVFGFLAGESIAEDAGIDVTPT